MSKTVAKRPRVIPRPPALDDPQFLPHLEQWCSDHLSQRELARLLGVSRQTFANWASRPRTDRSATGAKALYEAFRSGSLVPIIESRIAADLERIRQLKEISWPPD